jgi:hypothetical protein
LFEEAKTNITIVDSYHPLAAGMEGRIPFLREKSSELFYLTSGRTYVGAEVAAKTQSGEAVIFGYKKGSEVGNGDVLEARRVGFGGPNMSGYSPEGIQLLRSAILQTMASDRFVVGKNLDE